MEKNREFAEDQNIVSWSSYQKNIYEHLKFTDKNIVITASPGSGKTTVLIECLNLIPKFKKTIFLSFSKAITKEIKSRVDDSIRVNTLHSLGSFYLHRSFSEKLKLVDNKYFYLALNKKHGNKKDNIKLAFEIQDIVKFIRLTLTALNNESVLEMCEKYELEFSDKSISKAISIIENIDPYDTKVIDFTDMLYLPVLQPQFIFEKFDYILVDEAQDLNACQIRFIENLMHSKTRIISCGDENQCIYGFSGSDITSFNKLKEKDNTVVLPLSISYRCPKLVVLEARHIYKDIEFFEKSQNGTVRRGEMHEIKEGDFVLCRNNLPLLKLFFQLIDRDIKASIIGKNIEEGLLHFIAPYHKIDKVQFLQELEETQFNLEHELITKGFSKPEKHPRYIVLKERIQLLELILSKIEKINLLERTICSIFDEEIDGVKLMSIHKSKGLENDRVFLLENYEGKKLLPSEYATLDWQKVQENNLLFVAITRAKKEFIYFDL